jgi:hypothetical protein
VVNANDFDNEASNNTTAAQLTYAGENTFTLAMEGNKNAVIAVGVCCTNFYLDRGEQAYPHLALSGGSHDNILWESRRGMISGSDSAMTVTPDSYPNSEMDQGSFWFGVSPAVAGRRFFCLGCVGATATYKGDLAALQLMTDRTGNRAAVRVAEAATDADVVSNFSISPNGTDLLGNSNLFFQNTTLSDSSLPIYTFNQRNAAGAKSSVFGRYAVGGTLVGDLICGFVNTSLAATTRCGFGLRSPAADAEVYPETIQGDGVILHPAVLPSAAALPACNGDTVAATVPNYPFATSATSGAEPGSGGKFNVSIRCDFDGAAYRWRIH